MIGASGEPIWVGPVKAGMPNVPLTADEFQALIAERDALRGELKVVKVERDLLKEKLNAYLRKLFVARTEARTGGQSELFNEAEALAATAVELATSNNSASPA